MPILQEMWEIVMRVFGGADSISLIIMLVVVVAAGLMLGELSRIIQVTVGALVTYGLLRLAYGITQGADPTGLPMVAWNQLKGMTVSDLTVFFLAFAIVIGAIHTIRNTVGEGH